MKVEEEQKSMITEYNSAKWLLKEIDTFQRSITHLNGKLVDEWSNQNEAGAKYIQKCLDKEYTYIVTISKRGILADFIIKKGLSEENPDNYEVIARFATDNILTEHILIHLKNCAKQIDLGPLEGYKFKPIDNYVNVQLSLF